MEVQSANFSIKEVSWTNDMVSSTNKNIGKKIKRENLINKSWKNCKQINMEIKFPFMTANVWKLTGYLMISRNYSHFLGVNMLFFFLI